MNRALHITHAFVLTAVTLVVFAPAFGLGFVSYDDDIYVYENLIVLDGLTWEGAREVFAKPNRPISCNKPVVDIADDARTPTSSAIFGTAAAANNASDQNFLNANPATPSAIVITADASTKLYTSRRPSNRIAIPMSST